MLFSLGKMLTRLASLIEKFGEEIPMGRQIEPSEVAPSYVFLASSDASYMTGQVLQPNGG
jgi:NAD(P)-dependent dehydrogenase (short-subunit alcohol dehydrogenase family)